MIFYNTKSMTAFVCVAVLVGFSIFPFTSQKLIRKAYGAINSTNLFNEYEYLLLETTDLTFANRHTSARQLNSI